MKLSKPFSAFIIFLPLFALFNIVPVLPTEPKFNLIPYASHPTVTQSHCSINWFLSCYSDLGGNKLKSPFEFLESWGIAIGLFSPFILTWVIIKLLYRKHPTTNQPNHDSLS